jgi:hypothetical protein
LTRAFACSRGSRWIDRFAALASHALFTGKPAAMRLTIPAPLGQPSILAENLQQ